MKLRTVHIQNFRGLRDLVLDLDDTTVLIGENNSGKTAVLAALRLCLRDLGPRRRVVFRPFDFHLQDAAAEPWSSNPIQITLTFSENTPGEWSDQTSGRLQRAKILQVGPGGRSHVILHVACAYDATSQEFDQNWSFLTPEGLPLKGLSSAALGTLQREVVYFYLEALRDAARHFDAKGRFWRPFLKSGQLPVAQRAEIERKLKEVNDLVVASHTSFDAVRSGLKKVQDVVPMASGDFVSIEAVPGRMFDLLSKAQIHLGTSTGAKVPVGQHGEGTQSLAVLMLFSAFLDTWSSGAAIVALEEPEAHLHPSAVRALWGVVTGIAGQKIISTHSGDLLSQVPATALRRLARTASGTKVFRLQPGTLTSKQDQQFNFHIRFARGELLFARCWLLVEGETEVTLLPEIARYLGINLERSGVRCVPHRHASIELFLKVAKDLGIRWCVLADNDQQGRSDQKHAQTYAADADLRQLLHVMPEDDIEGHLCAAGFGDVYEAQLSEQTRPRVQASRGDPAYWPEVLKAIKKSLRKPAAALEVVERIRAGHGRVPPLLETCLREAVALAGDI